MNESIDISELKDAAAGRAIDILVDVAGIQRDLLDGRNHPCPMCGGTDRFRMLNAKTGGVRCNQCFTDKCGDFLAAVQWATGQTFQQTIHACAGYLGVTAVRNDSPVDVLVEFCRRKHITPESLERFRAMRSVRGDTRVVKVPMFGTDGLECGYQDCGLTGALTKGLTNKGGKGGLFAVGKPTTDSIVCIVEGFKDAAKLDELGYQAVGTPGTTFKAEWAGWFRKCHVVLIPDRDQASYKHFTRVGKLLDKVAASIGVVHLPFEITESEGKDVRDLVQHVDGEATLRRLISEAAVHAEDDMRKLAMVSLNCEALKALYSRKWTASELAERQIARLEAIRKGNQ